MSKQVQLLSGNQAVVKGCIDAGAEFMFGYPITPATEILQGWIAEASSNSNLKYLQTEDEIAAGFSVIGSVLAGKKAFTSSAGPGNILLQDSMAMAENLRLPFVGIMMQRGGPSTGTVNFSQQEVNLAAFGGNGDGLRIVYSASSVTELYYLTIKAFSSAWKYRFPTVLLGDGYLAKMKTNVSLSKPLNPVSSKLILKEENTPTYLRNCYSDEESFGKVLDKNIEDWNVASHKVAESEYFGAPKAKIIIFAHGIIAAAVKDAVSYLRAKRISIALFRPITLNPIDKKGLLQSVKSAKRAFVIESSLNQFSRIIKYELSGNKLPITEIAKPARGFTPEEIISLIEKEIHV